MPHRGAASRSTLASQVLARLLVFAALVCCGCWQARQGPGAPDLTAQNDEVDLTIERLTRLSETVDGELVELRTRTDAFFDAPQDAWRKPFPLDAFKHTAMSCLNAPYNEAAPEPVVQEAADRLGITCAVAAALDLERRMAEAPSSRAVAMGRLLQIDEVRSLRAKLQSRLRQLPSILRRTRSYLGTRRAEARQMVKDVQSRQGEYSRKSYTEAMVTIERYEARLASLERQVAIVEDSAGRWSKRLAEIVDDLYNDLSRLGRS